MSFVDVDRRSLVLVLTVLVVAMGGMFYQLMYKPKQVERDTAAAALAQAQTGLQARQQELKGLTSKGIDNSPQGKLNLAKAAIPQDPNDMEGTLAVRNLAKVSGVTITGSEPQGSAGADTGTLGDEAGATPIDVQLQGYGSLTNVLLFVQRLEDEVSVHSSKVYVKGRLMSVQDLQLSFVEATSSIAADEEGAPSSEAPPGSLSFSMIVRMYADSPAADTGGAGVGTDGQAAGSATTTPGAAAPDASTGTTGTDANAPQDGSAGAADSGTQGTTAPAGTDTSAAGSGTTSPSTDIPAGAS